MAITPYLAPRATFSHALALTFAAFLVRMWVGMRLYFAGIDKYRVWGKDAGDVAAENDRYLSLGTLFKNSEGKLQWPTLPSELYHGDHYQENTEALRAGMKKWTALEPGHIDLYLNFLGFGLMVVGLAIMVGFLRHISLLLGGLLFLSLAVGLMIMGDEDGAANNIGIGVLMTSVALAMSRWDRISMDTILLGIPSWLAGVFSKKKNEEGSASEA
jgi:hypothetical protein